MHHLLLPIILRLLQDVTKAQDIITGIWNDDFKHDKNGLTGWNMYYIQGPPFMAESLGNPIVQGTTNKYHGYFNTYNYRYGRGGYNMITRKFKCSSDSHIYISYSFNFCQTESVDYWYLYKLNASFDTYTNYMRLKNSISDDYMKRHDMSVGCTDCDNFASVEPEGIWKNNLPSGIDSTCTTENNYKYKAVQNQYMGKKAANAVFNITFTSHLSANNEYTFLWNVQIHCDSLTVYPTIQPSTIPTSTPSLLPSKQPSLIPTITPTPLPTVSPTDQPTEVIATNPIKITALTPTVLATDSQMSVEITEEIPEPIFKNDTNIESNNSFLHKDLIIVSGGSSILIVMLFIVICTLCVMIKRIRKNGKIKSTQVAQYDYDLDGLQAGNTCTNCSSNFVVDEQKQTDISVHNSEDNVHNRDYLHVSNANDKMESDSEQLFVPMGTEHTIVNKTNILNLETIEKNCMKSWFNQKIKIPNLQYIYYQLFVDNGYETIEIVQLLTEDKLKKIGIKKQGHIDKIMMEIDSLKSAMQSDEPVTIEGHNVKQSIINIDTSAKHFYD